MTFIATTTNNKNTAKSAFRSTVVIEWNHDGKLFEVKDRTHRVIGLCAFFFVDWIVIDVGCSPLPSVLVMKDRCGNLSLFWKFHCDIFSNQIIEVIPGRHGILELSRGKV
jgi:hypothetical protein